MFSDRATIDDGSAALGSISLSTPTEVRRLAGTLSTNSITSRPHPAAEGNVDRQVLNDLCHILFDRIAERTSQPLFAKAARRAFGGVLEHLARERGASNARATLLELGFSGRNPQLARRRSRYSRPGQLHSRRCGRTSRRRTGRNP